MLQLILIYSYADLQNPPQKPLEKSGSSKKQIGMTCGTFFCRLPTEWSHLYVKDNFNLVIRKGLENYVPLKLVKGRIQCPGFVATFREKNKSFHHIWNVNEMHLLNLCMKIIFEAKRSFGQSVLHLVPIESFFYSLYKTIDRNSATLPFSTILHSNSSVATNDPEIKVPCYQKSALKLAPPPHSI